VDSSQVENNVWRIAEPRESSVVWFALALYKKLTLTKTRNPLSRYSSTSVTESMARVSFWNMLRASMMSFCSYFFKERFLLRVALSTDALSSVNIPGHTIQAMLTLGLLLVVILRQETPKLGVFEIAE